MTKRRKQGQGWPWIVAAGAGLILGTTLIVLSVKPPEDPVTSHGEEIASVRTIVVADSDSGVISEPGRPLHAVLTGGAMPAIPMEATVLTDENCAPDGDGVSHCTNRLRMDDGSTMSVMHPHRMADVPCLAPGETVLVRSA